MEHYRENLRHVAEPAVPDDREDAVKVCLEDYEALWFGERLRTFAHYGDVGSGKDDIALSYEEYIDKKIRVEERPRVCLYAHTMRAAETLLDALYHESPSGVVGVELTGELAARLSSLFLHHFEGEADVTDRDAEADE